MGEEPENQPQQKNTSFLAWLIDHVFTKTLLAILTIVGFFLTIYFYRASTAAPDLTYYISPTRTAIVQKGSINNLSVSYLGTTITGDLSSAEIQIWNQGKSPIHKENILKTITLKTPNHEKFYTISYTTTRNDVIGFELLDNTNNETGSQPMSWKILEHNDGIKLQVIYGGNVALPLTLVGAIEGQQQGITKLSRINSYRPNYGIFIYILIVMVCVWGMHRFENKRFQEQSLFNRLAFLVILFSLSLLLELIFYLTSSQKPPFGM